MIAEIISVGTELLLGEVVNTNARDIMRFLKETGIDVYYGTTVGDNPQRLEESIKLAFNRGADLVITSGGIGPTNDDLTKEISCRVFGLNMEYRPEEAEKIRAKVAFLGSDAKSNYKQAYFGAGAVILENEVGTANACVISKDNKRIINLPGPPRELNYILNHSLKDYFGQSKLRLYQREYAVLGIGESQLADILQDLFLHQETVTMALYAMEGYVRIRLAVKSTDEEKANELFDEKAAILRSRLGDHLHDYDEALSVIPPFSLDLGNATFLKDFFYGQFQIDQDATYHVSCRLTAADLGERLTVTARFKKEKTIVISSLKKAVYARKKNEHQITALLKEVSRDA